MTIILAGGGIVAIVAYLTYKYRLRPGTVEVESVGDPVPATPMRSEPAQPSSAATSKLPRNLRNHNPGNLRYFKSIAWQGQVGDDGDGYAVFVDDLSGMRAAFINLWSSIITHGNVTVRDIITRWAPHVENPTQNYINFVASKIGVSPDQLVNYPTHSTAIMKAIVQFEGGLSGQYYSNSLYDNARAAAGKG